MHEERSFETPGGNTARFLVRPGTNDAMMAESAVQSDEYGLRGLRLGDGVVVDVGAHIGQLAVAVALDHPDARVIAVEPLPENVDLMRRNVALNGVADRVEILEGAVAAPRKKTVTVAYGFAGGEGETMHRYVGNQTMPDGTEHQTVKVPAITLAMIVSKAKGSVALLVTDCEGGEYGLLADPAVAMVDDIRGEYHGGYAALVTLLEGTHDVTQVSGDAYFGGFRAVRRP